MQRHLQLQCVHVSPLSYFFMIVWCFRFYYNRVSFRKRRGHQPTGVFTNTEKEVGFSSVSEMLIAERLNHENVGTATNASPENVGALKITVTDCGDLQHYLSHVPLLKFTGSCIFCQKEREGKF